MARPSAPDTSTTGDNRHRGLTIDELARAAGTTTRQVRALQTLGLLPHPGLVGRTGYYDTGHLDRLQAIVRLQSEGFSLASLRSLLRAWESNMTLGQVLGLRPQPVRVAPHDADAFGALAETLRSSPSRRGRLLSLVPSTILDQAAAS
jgi:DNA-binding transcriptional MerR regulator